MTDPLADLARLEGVPSAVVAARDAVDAVLRDRGLRQIPAATTAEALLAGASASAELEGDRERWLPGAVRLSTELIDLAQLIRTSPGQVLARAHTLLAHGQAPEESLGRLRPGGEVSERVRGLNQTLTGRTEAPALVLAAVAHAELATLVPFGPGDGILGRAVEHMILISAGLDPRAATVPAAGHLRAERQGGSYFASLTSYRSGTARGVRDWLIHCARAVAYGAELSPLAQSPPGGGTART
ncbi:hypothetical protein GCM10009841_01380 [Microlunatus panaciterrae]|uniref:Fido domain-containing protein n=1 Tax=Microlunatus panaciterrae TaxID=400768 RepID=A0ABS2RJN8_9ACTN|nr:oxidoreductase [Microlunatus panaciterrae]MBM7799220.1 hypothetical protein [Microlunatus panaciterrae]